MSPAVLLSSVVALVITAALIGVDVYLAADGRPGNTWSEVIRFWSAQLVILPWGWGGLAGHFFHPDRWPRLQQPAGIAVLVWLTVLLHLVNRVTPLPPLAAAVVGLLTWSVLWPCQLGS